VLRSARSDPKNVGAIHELPLYFLFFNLFLPQKRVGLKREGFIWVRIGGASRRLSYYPKKDGGAKRRHPFLGVLSDIIIFGKLQGKICV
jgi:hypothetical protein